MKTTLGGDRLGSGNKQKISMRNYERSTHDLSYIWRSTAAAGTLIPFMSEVALPGDTFDIDLECNVMTHPTIGPLFGTFKVQLDVFSCPIRLYNGKLHMNKLGVGMKMSEVKLPQIRITADTNIEFNTGDNYQINPSCIFSYLNIRGIGLNKLPSADPEPVSRDFNALTYLMYWDIYKNYYANKQEEVGYVIHNGMNSTGNTILDFKIYTYYNTYDITTSTTHTIDIWTTLKAEIYFDGDEEPLPQYISILFEGTRTPINEIWQEIIWNNDTKKLICDNPKDAYLGQEDVIIGEYVYGGQTILPVLTPPILQEFDLINIDKMREKILKAVDNTSPFLIDDLSLPPYGLPLQKGNINISPTQQGWSKLSSQEGLGLKTYQSDLFNNWISTEWIDGDNGINAITSIDTTSGNFTIDSLNMANKVYNMLNRIALSGGTYDDWLDATYTHERAKSVESPIYMGSLIKELSFEEVISNSAGINDGVTQPLGTLAGRGKLTNKHKGGKIRIKVDEPSYIIGIFSLTPRLDYSQGNKWDVNLKTMDDFHKPALDEIGFQDLITDQLAWMDTKIAEGEEPTFKSAGKQPAWINYMTNVNQTRGNFAEQNEQMWMTLNRRYEDKTAIGMPSGIKDLTTYIDPVKFNYIFAETALDAQNYWVQIANNITARRKMSAKVIPNL